MAESADQIRVTVLYPLPFQPEQDTFLKDLAALNDGDFIGSGTNGMERDLVFDLPMLCFGVPNNLSRFLESVLKQSCQILLATFDPQGLDAENLEVAELG